MPKKIFKKLKKPLDNTNKKVYNIITIKGSQPIARKGQYMTNRDFYSAIINGTINEEVVAKATEELGKLDARNDKRRNTLSKEQLANEEFKKSMVEFIGESKLTASEIAKGLEISTQKVSALAKQLVDNGTLVKEEVAVKGKGKVLAYSLAE